MTRLLEVEAEDVGEKWMALHTNWISGESSDGGLSFTLDSTAGLGGATLVLSVEKGGVTRRESIDIRPLLTSWVDGIAEEMGD